MQTSDLNALDKAIQHTNEWLERLMEIGSFSSRENAWIALRGVLWTLRDRLDPGEACHIASHMPLLVRGMYYEGFKPTGERDTARTPQKFKQSVIEHLPVPNPAQVTFDIDAAITAVLKLVDEKIDKGEVEQVREMLPKDVRRRYT